ncbi:hypothetical protein [Nonlabens xiamenensis]|uniref:hypothetical protein n=1 Tax=Nonlabens xiamenensis TaxID=2341043 RepID=UPI000F60F2C7|nr:hypothetical protein [Nonlabens xiamenensis]
MIYMNNVRVIENVVVYGDDKKMNVFYPIPEQPRFRLDDEGKPIFKFLKYKMPIDRGDGKKGGGFAVFDVEFTIPDDKMERIKEKLQEEVNAKAQKRNINPVPEVKIATIRYTEGTSRLMISDENSVLVERIIDAGKPSLFGKNIATFSMELSEHGATFFEQALQGEGGFVSVMYELYYGAKLPPLRVTARFNASSFYQFIQEIDISERVCAEDDYRETLNEIMVKSESSRIDIDPGSADIDPKVIEQVRTWAQGALDKATERLMIQEMQMEDPAEARKYYQEHDIEDVRKEVTKRAISSYKLDYREETYVNVNINPQGTMPNITTLKDKSGAPIKWEDYAQEIDLQDKFFKQINARVRVNAPFDEMPIHSVEVKLSYKGEPMDVLGSDVNGEYQFSSAEDTAEFATFIQDDDFHYDYSYQVNYKGSAQTFQSEVMSTDESVLTINVDEMGIIFVEVLPGDLDFEQIKQAQILMEYEANGVDKVADQFIMTAEQQQHKFEHIIFKKRTEPYRYKVVYKMTDGKEFTSDWQEGESSRLYINDPFSQTKTVGFRSFGDLENDIANIFIDATYADEDNDYRTTQTIALSKAIPFFDWTFPQINSAVNTISYKGHIVRHDGTNEDIAEVVTEDSTILVGAKKDDVFEIKVNPGLLDMGGTVKMANVQLEYKDEANDILEKEDFTFTAQKADEVVWNVDIKDKNLKQYTWKATFFMTDKSRITTDPQTTDELTLFIDLPSNS